MQKALNDLIKLQRLDQKLQKIKMAGRDLPKKLQQFDMEIENLKEELANRGNAYEEMKRSRRNLEMDVDDLEKRIAKSQNKLMEIKSNKEYKAALKEIDDLKLMKQEKEDALLGLMERLDHAESELAAIQTRIKEKIDLLIEQKEHIQREYKKQQEGLTELQKERETIASSIPKDLLEKYQFLRGRLNGTAIAAVRDSTCLACFMNVTPQQVIELQKEEKILTCPNCNRIIYWEEYYQETDEN